MSLQGIFDPIVKAYYKKKYGGGSDSGEMVKNMLEVSRPYSVENALATVVNTEFANDKYLASVDLPNATKVSSSCFYRCQSLTAVNFPNLKQVYEKAFYECTSLTSINFPNATSISKEAFYGCTSLTSVNLPNATSISNSAFDDCTSLTSVDLSKAYSIGKMAFDECTSLTSIDLPNVTSIGSSAFYGCTSLTALILRYTIAPCAIDLFSLGETPAMEGMGHIYVPTSLYENYRTIYEPQINQLMPGFFDILFRKIEDYPEICGAN